MIMTMTHLRSAFMSNEACVRKVANGKIALQRHRWMKKVWYILGTRASRACARAHQRLNRLACAAPSVPSPTSSSPISTTVALVGIPSTTWPAIGAILPIRTRWSAPSVCPRSAIGVAHHVMRMWMWVLLLVVVRRPHPTCTAHAHSHAHA